MVCRRAAAEILQENPECEVVSTCREVRVLFFSSMVVSPATGGGNAAYNVLESGPAWSKVFYATSTDYLPERQPFQEITPRICRFFNVNRPLPQRLEAVGTMRWIGKQVTRINDWVQRETIVRDVARCAERENIDVLLICPQNARVDLPAAPELVERTRLPSVAWFMDDYFADELSRERVREVWNNAHRRFVASESMQEHFSRMYGGECEMINNSVAFPESFSEPADRLGSRVRMVYAGAINSYYLSSMSAALSELQGLGDRIELDIYSPDKLPPEWQSKTDIPWRHLPPIPADEFIERLQEYDVLLLLSSFDPEWRVVAETAQAGKMADYLAAGRCILAYGPEYADNVRYLNKYGIGETVTSQEPGMLSETILSLSEDPGRRKEVGERAYYFGREHRDKDKNSARLWQALYEASNAPPLVWQGHNHIGEKRSRAENIFFDALNALGKLKQVVKKVVKKQTNGQA